jgi:hypothetical protein
VGLSRQCIAAYPERPSYYDTDRFVPVGRADHGPDAEFSSRKANMSERSSHLQIMTREELLASFKNQGITSLEDLVDSVFPEVGGLAIDGSSGP